MSIIDAPSRSLDQRMEALHRANEIRTRRAQLKRDIKAGRALARDVIADPPDWAETMKVRDLLLSAPAFGKVKTDKVLAVCRVSPAKTLGGLSARQRAELMSRLSARTQKPWRAAPARPTAPGEVPQHLQAHALANRTRIARSWIRREVAAMPRDDGGARLAALILDPPEAMRSVTVGDALTWQHRTGVELAGRTLRDLAINPQRHVGDLTDRQRKAVAARLDPNLKPPAGALPHRIFRPAPVQRPKVAALVIAPQRRSVAVSGVRLRERINGIVQCAAGGVTEAQLGELTGADLEEVAYQVGELLLDELVALSPDGRYLPATAARAAA